MHWQCTATLRCRYAEAAAALRSHISLGGAGRAQELLATATQRQMQQEQGHYDMDALHKASAETGAGASDQCSAPAFRHLDCAEFVHSALAVADLPGKGWGLVATKAIAAGQLVMAVRAEQMAYTVSAWLCPPLPVPTPSLR